MQQIEIKTSHGNVFIVDVSNYDAVAIADELNDTTNRKTVFAIGGIVIGRNAIVYIAPVEVVSTGQQA